MSGEVIERTDIFKGEFSPSGLMSGACLRRLYYEKVLKLGRKHSTLAMDFGSCIHGAVEEFYKHHNSGLEVRDLQQIVVQKFVEQWSLFGHAGDNKRNLDSGMLIMSHYVQTYFHDTSSFHHADIECTQWVAMPNGTKLLIKVDRVMDNGTIRRIIDTKTTSSSLTDFYFKKYENDMQMSLYDYGMGTVLGDIDDILIDAIRVPMPIREPSTGFGRRTFSRTELQIQDCLNSYVKVTDYIMDSLAKPQETWANSFYCNTSECDKYSGCPFLGVCKYGLDHPSVRVELDDRSDLDRLMINGTVLGG